jgi:predicted transcriptional regulator of viral defense system
MKLSDALQTLSRRSLAPRGILTKAELHSLFPSESQGVFDASLRRLVKHGLLERVASGIYRVHHAPEPPHLLEEVAVLLRRGDYCYLSLESALSEYGLISQMPIDRITVMTTGRSGEFPNPYGVIEFTHTNRSVADILTCTIDRGRPLRLATRHAALRDLKRVGRNVALVDDVEINDAA